MRHLIIFLAIICKCFLSINGESSDNVKSIEYENNKILRKSINFAYNGYKWFLQFIRPVSNATFITIDFRIRPSRDFKFVPGPIYIEWGYRLFMGYTPLVILVILGLLFVILLPCVGIIFCLCRCNGKCGGRIKSMDPKRAKFKRYIYGFLLGLFSIVMLIGLVLASISIQLFYDVVSNANKTNGLLASYREGTDIVMKRLPYDDLKLTKNCEIDNLCTDEGVARYIYKIEHEYQNAPTKDLLNYMERLLKLKDIDKNSEFFKSMKTTYSNLLNFYNNEKNFTSVIERKTCKEIRDRIKKQCSALKLYFDEKSLRSYCYHYYAAIRNIIDNLGFYRYENNFINLSQLKSIFDMVMYSIIGLCCLLLLIILFYFLGLCFGLCGERPYEDARMCNRGVGANLMIAGATFVILFTPTAMILAMGLFFPGSLYYLDVCRILTNNVEEKYIPYNDPIHSSTPAFFPRLTFFTDSTRNVPYRLRNWQSIEVLQQMTEKIMNDLDPKTYLRNRDIDLRSFSENLRAFIKTSSSSKYKKVLMEIDSHIEKNDMIPFKDLFLKIDKKYRKEYVYVAIDSMFNNATNENFTEINRGAKILVHALCYIFVDTINGIWVGLGIYLLFTIPSLIVAVKLSGLYRRTEIYASDYEEPDYNSYMGFYTNNTENIPMKRQKNGDKSRNSKNSNQPANPQYLPVYPYDAYE